jgi:tetratricopeptide (TPR) repeat protein
MIATRTMVMLSTVALALLAGCAGEMQEDPMLADKIAKADEVFKSRQYEEAGVLFEEIAGEAVATGDDSAFVEAASMRARSYLIAQKKDEGREWLVRAAAKAIDSDPAGWSRYLGVRGRFEWQDENLETATTTFREMFDYCGEKELWERAVDAAHMIAITGDPREKFDWSLKGIEMAEKGGMDGWLAPLWNNLGWNYHDDERYGEAYDALVKAREYHYKGEGELPKLIADYSVAHIMMKQNRLHEAEAAMLKVLEWATKLDAEGAPDAVEWMGFARWDIAEMVIESGDRATGIGMLKDALGEIEKSGMPNWDAEQWKQKQNRVAELEG